MSPVKVLYVAVSQGQGSMTCARVAGYTSASCFTTSDLKSLGAVYDCSDLTCIWCSPCLDPGLDQYVISHTVKAYSLMLTAYAGHHESRSVLGGCHCAQPLYVSLKKLH